MLYGRRNLARSLWHYLFQVGARIKKRKCGMAYFEMPEVGSGVDIDDFLKSYYLPRRPVVIRNVPLSQQRVEQLQPGVIHDILSTQNSGANQDMWWWNTTKTFLNDYFDEPEIYTKLIGRIRALFCDEPNRLWACSEGTHTLWHYDNCSLEIFNIQLLGAKKFTLVDPSTPLRCARFSIGCLNGFDDKLQDENWTEVTLRPGDMLYIPRHWFHKVESLASWNLNYNWTWTDFDVPLDTVHSVREKEITVLLACFARIVELIPSRFLKSSHRRKIWGIKTYGGLNNYGMAKMFFQKTNVAKLMKRLWIELGMPRRTTVRKQLRNEELRLNRGVARSADDYWKKIDSAKHEVI